MSWLDDFRQQYAGRYASTPEPEAPTPQQNSGLFGNIGNAIHHVVQKGEDLVGDAAHDVSNVAGFFGNLGKTVGEGVVDIIPQAISDFGETAKTMRDLVLSPIKQHQANDIINQVSDLNHQWSQKTANWSAADFNDPKNKAIAQAHFDQIKALNDRAQTIIASDTIKDRDAKKSAAAAGNTVLNIGTLGLGGVAEQGAKLATKVGVTGAADVARNLATKSAAKVAEEAVANRTAAGATKTIAKNVGEGAAIGGAYGATNEFGDNASPDKIWQGALTGAAVGGLFGGGGSLLDKNVRAGAREVPGAVRDANAAMGEGGYVRNPFALGGQDEVPLSQLGGNRPANDLQGQLEDAWNNNDLQTAQKVIDQLPPDLKAPMQSMQDQRIKTSGTPLEQASSGAELARRQLNGEDVRPLSPEDQQNMDIAHSIAAGYNSPEQHITELARNALDAEKSKGITLQPNADGTKSRVSDHASWYSDYYREHGKAPSLQATKDIVEEGLKSGRGVDGAVMPEESDVHNLLADREAGLQQTLQEGPPQEMSAQYMNDLAGKPQGAPVPKDPQRTLKLGNAKGKFQEPVLPPGTPNASTEVFPANQRGFFRNVRTSETASPELKAAVGDVKPQTYDDISTNRELVQNAIHAADENPQAIHDKITSGNELNDQDVVSGMHLMNRYQQEGKIDDAVRLADSLDTNLRAHGRAVQAASVWGRLTPEGLLRTASNRFSKAREDISAGRGYGKGVGAEKKVAKDIQDTVEQSGQLTQDHVIDAIRKTADNIGSNRTAKEAEKLTTGQKVAKNVEKMATPVQKKKADLLVKEITKKVKQEMMTPPAKGEAKSAIDVMREVFGRNKEAQEAFPEAQRILMEKAKDNPKIQEALQKFFESELGNPAASSTFNAAIKEQLGKSETKVSEIIMNSWKGQDESIEKVAAELVKEGFDKESATAIATEVKARLKAQVVAAKQRTLQSLAKDAPKRQKTMFLDKVTKLSNLGALDDHDYLELARHKLKLPQLTSETAQQVSELAQKMQDMEPGYERDKMGRQIYKVINDSIPKTLGQKAAELVSAPKSIMASLDLSATLRQGGVLGSRFRKEAADSFKKSVKYFGSSEEYEKGMSAIRHDPMYETAARAKIALTGVEGGEEAFISQLPERIPGLGKGIQASDRAYTGALTELRFNSFKHMAKDLADEGIDINSFSDEQLESIGKFINTASGRGYGAKNGLFEKMAPALNRTLFSPRLWKSRLDMLNPVYYAKLDPISRKYALQSAGSFAAIAATVMGLATLAGGKVETDPRSSDFLKVRFGDTRYDILGGFQQNLVFAARELSGQKKNSSTGAIADLSSGSFGSANRLSILTDLIANKQNPVLAAGENILEGHDQSGNKVNPLSELGGLAVPLNIQDTVSLAKSTNPLQALLMGTLPGTVGVGVNTYPTAGSGAPSQAQTYSRSLLGQ
jgi:hypothetical protein